MKLQHGPLPLTWECRTGGGGRHLFFALPGDGTVKSKNDALGKGLDFKANGGFVIAAGSHHVSGRRYEWSVDGHPDDWRLAELPAWIVAALERHTPVTAGVSWDIVPALSVPNSGGNASRATFIRDRARNA